MAFRLVRLVDGKPNEQAFYEFNGRCAVIGTEGDVALPFALCGVAKRHCEISMADECYIIKNLSAHRTYVNGEDMGEGMVRLNTGAKIKVGPHEYEFRTGECE